MSLKEKYAALEGKSFGKLTVVHVTETISALNRASYRLICRCECGNYTSPRFSNLNGGGTTSCGCVRKEKWRKAYYAWVTNKDVDRKLEGN